jgi:uncharacterized protein GlcG (DUF336 family)
MALIEEAVGAFQACLAIYRDRLASSMGAATSAIASGLLFSPRRKRYSLSATFERSKTVPVLVNLFKSPHLLLLGGGIVIKVGDEVVGAIGAAGAPGGDLDDACAHAGLDKIIFHERCSATSALSPLEALANDPHPF